MSFFQKSGKRCFGISSTLAMQWCSHTRASLGTGPGNYTVLGLGNYMSELTFEHIVNLSTSGQVGLPGYGFQVAHGGQVGQQNLLSYVK